MNDSVFTKIVKGEIPCHKVYEDDKTLAFLDIHPVQPGHTLVIPKTQIEFVWDLAPEDYAALMATVQKVAQRLRAVMGTAFVGEQIEGIDVPHAHVHLIPFSVLSEFRSHAADAEPPDHAVLAGIAKKLSF